MQNAKWRTPYNSREMEKSYEVNNDPSKTIPDQSLSVKEILTRYAQGLPLEGAKVPVYNGDEIYPDLARLDLSERHDLMEANAQRIKDMQEDLIYQKKRKQKTSQKKEEKPATDSAALSAGASGEAEA